MPTELTPPTTPTSPDLAARLAAAEARAVELERTLTGERSAHAQQQREAALATASRGSSDPQVVMLLLRDALKENASPDALASELARLKQSKPYLFPPSGLPTALAAPEADANSPGASGLAPGVARARIGFGQSQRERRSARPPAVS
jgi:hypothetical protein